MVFVDRVATRSTEAPHITHYNPLSLLLLFLPFFLISHVHEGRSMKLTICYTLPLHVAVPLDAFSHTAVSGAYLQYGRTRLYDPQPNVTLTVGATNQRVACLQSTGQLPTSIEWYNPQGQLVSRNNRDEVNQAVGGRGRVAQLTFRSYQQSQGGAYECRVAGLGNNTKRVLVCIGERYIF